MADEPITFTSYNFSQSLVAKYCPKFYKALRAVNWDSVIDYSTLSRGQVDEYLKSLAYMTFDSCRTVYNLYHKSRGQFLIKYKADTLYQYGHISFNTSNRRTVYTVLFPITGSGPVDTPDVLTYDQMMDLEINNAGAGAVGLYGPDFLENSNPIVLCLLTTGKVYYDDLNKQENSVRSYFQDQRESSGTWRKETVEAILGISEGGDFGIRGIHKDEKMILPQVKIDGVTQDHPDSAWKRFYGSIYISGTPACNQNGSIAFPGIKKLVYPGKSDSEILTPYYYSTASPYVKNNQYTCFKPFQDASSKDGEPIIIHTTSSPQVSGIQIRFRMQGLFKQQEDKNDGEPIATRYFFYVHARKLGSTKKSDWFPVVNQGADNNVVSISPEQSISSNYSNYFNSIFIYGASRKDADLEDNKVQMIDTTTNPSTKVLKVDYTDKSYRKKLDAEIRASGDVDYTIAYNLSNSQVTKSQGSISYYLGDRNVWLHRTFFNVKQETRLLGDLVISPGSSPIDWVSQFHQNDWQTTNFTFKVVSPEYIKTGDGSVQSVQYDYITLNTFKETIKDEETGNITYLKYTLFRDMLEIGRADSYDTLVGRVAQVSGNDKNSSLYSYFSSAQKTVFREHKQRTRTVYISYDENLPPGTKFLQGDIYFSLAKENAFYYTGLHWYASGLSFFPDQLSSWVPFQGSDNFGVNSYNNVGTGWYNDTGDFDTIIDPDFVNLAVNGTSSEGIKYNIYSFTGNESTPFTYDFLFPLPKEDNGRYELRVGFPVHSLSKIKDITLESVTELFTGHIPLRGIATAQYMIPFTTQEAKDFAINSVYDGVKVRVPSNYYGPSRKVMEDSGGNPIPWDGLFKTEGDWTDCPAWIIYALLVDTKFGLIKQQPKLLKGYDKQGNPIYRINKWSFYEFQQFCDQRIYKKPPNTAGYLTSGSEPRFSFNYYINESTTIDQLLGKICGEYGANLYTDAFGDLCITADYDYPPVAVVTKSNVVNGEFLYSEASLNEITNSYVATFNNKLRDYKEQSVRIEMPWAIKKYGSNEATLKLYGCTSESEAKRRTRLKVFKSVYSSRTVTFNVGSMGAYMNIGNKILVYDTSCMDTQTGRVVQMVTRRILKLSKPINLVLGVTYNLTFNIANPNFQLNGRETDLAFKVIERNYTHDDPSGAYTQIVLPVELAELLPEDSIFTITNTAKGYGSLYQITSISTQKNQSSIVASYFDVRQNNYMDYGSFTISNDTEDQYIEKVINDPTFNYTEPPGYIETHLEYIKDKKYYNMRLTWPSNPKPIQGYIVKMYGEHETKEERTKNNTFTYENIALKDLKFSVQTVSKTGESSQEVYTNFRYSFGVLIYEAPYNLRVTGFNGPTDIKPLRDFNFSWDYTDTADWESFDVEFYGNSFITSSPNLSYGTLIRKINVKDKTYLYKKADLLADFIDAKLLSSSAKFVPFTNDNGLKVLVNPVMNSALLYKGNGRKIELFTNPILNSPMIQNLTAQVLSLSPPSAKINVAIKNPTDPYITQFDIYYATTNSSSAFVFYGTLSNQLNINGSQVFSSSILLNSKYSTLYVKVQARSDFGDISDFSTVEQVSIEWD